VVNPNTLLTMLGDPVLALATSIGLASLFLTAALHKLQQRAAFRTAMEGYGFVPPALLEPASRMIPAAEAAAAIGLLMPQTRSFGALLGAGLLLAYGVAMTLVVVQGRRTLDCGCSLGGTSQPVSGALIVRNAILALLALNAARATESRELLLYDWALSVLMALVAIVLYAIVNTVTASQAVTRKIANE
jgi:hypothetical protein